MKYLHALQETNKTVFTYGDIAYITHLRNHNSIKSFFARWVKEWFFLQPYKWIYTFTPYNVLEFAVKVKKNSYISFESVLFQKGIIFQNYGNSIFCASDNTITKKIDDTHFIFLKIKKEILTNPLWIIHTWGYSIASAERAICDRIYLSKNYYFDNLSDIDFIFLERMATIYNKRVILTVKKLINDARSKQT